MTGTLFVVSTPIGNAEDITKRAARILNDADIIAAEDTRTAQRLFNILEIRGKTVSNHKFNERRQAEFLTQALLQGKNIALISDAGTPCISDPGCVLVEAAVKKGATVTPVCGASAVIAALSVSGFMFETFAFYGFLPKNKGQLSTMLKSFEKKDTDVFVFYESPKRIKKTLEVFKNETPQARICLCNDLTKLHERIYRGSPSNVANELMENPNAEKGEYALVVMFEKKENAEINNDISCEALLTDYMVKNNADIKQAIAALSEIYKGRKKEFYNASLRLKGLF